MWWLFFVLQRDVTTHQEQAHKENQLQLKGLARVNGVSKSAAWQKDLVPSFHQ
jgi:hypothetical protein